jgi:hypothetical protein
MLYIHYVSYVVRNSLRNSQGLQHVKYANSTTAFMYLQYRIKLKESNAIIVPPFKMLYHNIFWKPHYL